MAETAYRSGFVAIAGRPNAGKSTLLNAMVGEKLAIVTSKPQTTRSSVQGVVTTPEAQIVFIDTPGIHRSDNYYNKRMMETIRTAIDAPDVRLFVHDASAKPGAADWEALDTLRRAAKDAPAPAFLVLNKIDQVKDKRNLLPLMDEFRTQWEFDEFVPVSASKGKGLEELKKLIVARLPEAAAIFPEDYLTDQPQRFLAAEMIREKILATTHDEVPHSIAVLIDTWEEKPALTRILATIYVERPGQKGIVIGAGGAMLKQIGTAARHDIEKFLGRKVFLEMFVKVRPKWRESAEFVNGLDWRSMVGDK